MPNPATRLAARAGDLYAGLAIRARLLEALSLLALRLVVARVFWQSGLGKVETIDLGPVRIPTLELQNSTRFLFRTDFFPELPRAVAEWMAFFAAMGELALPILLVLGFLARIGAIGLLVMTMVIQVFVFPGEWWSVHVWWAVILLHLAVRGPGPISIDRRIGLEKPANG